MICVKPTFAANRLLTEFADDEFMTRKMPLWWLCVLMVATAAALAGCDSPSPKFSGLTGHRISVDGSQFSVRHTDQDAEAVRISKELRPGRGEVVLKGAKAIELASGCRVLPTSLDGDTNYVRADIDCS